MSFDSRSLERLKQLGRELPQPLAKPEAPRAAEAPASRKRHRVETEEDPQALFHELMKVSADGTVPEHLMARLKQAEQKAEEERKQRTPLPGPTNTNASVRPSSSGSTPLPAPPSRRSGKGKNTQPRRLNVAPGSEEESMYVAFGQLFLEDDEDNR
mgnify:CR=1 FL=1